MPIKTSVIHLSTITEITEKLEERNKAYGNIEKIEVIDIFFRKSSLWGNMFSIDIRCSYENELIDEIMDGFSSEWKSGNTSIHISKEKYLKLLDVFYSVINITKSKPGLLQCDK